MLGDIIENNVKKQARLNLKFQKFQQERVNYMKTTTKLKQKINKMIKYQLKNNTCYLKKLKYQKKMKMLKIWKYLFYLMIMDN